MFAFKAGFAAAATVALLAAAPAQAADLDYAYNDPTCMTAAEYAGLSGSGLASAVGSDVAANPACGYDACSAGDAVGGSAQRAIGAGLAQAYSQFASAGDRQSAGSVADAACGCSAGGGAVSASFAGSAGGGACSVNYGSETTYGGMGTVGSLFYIRAAGGGGGGGLPQSPN
jgi:hypothetical protein